MVSGATIIMGDPPIGDTLTLFLLQTILIVTISRIIAVPLRYLRQPVVIAEVLGGIILGPSVLGRIPGFRDALFPDIGLEIDLGKLATSFKRAAVISIAGIAVPFASAIGLSVLVYNKLLAPEMNTPDAPHIPISTWMVFCGVAMSVTAFPILVRVLAERKLMKTHVGQTTLSAAAGDDLMAWMLLVIVVALIKNPDNTWIALYVVLAVVGWTIILLIGVRPLLTRLIDTFDNDADAPVSSVSMMTVLVMACISGWLTQSMGVDAMMGSFLIGVATPHHHGFAIKLTEKIEDLVSTLFLPLYFAYTGLFFSVDSVSDATSWGITVLIILVACLSKTLGCGIGALISGLPFRESLTIGILMNTRGLVEMIVLGIGLQDGLIDTKVYTMFVMMTVVTTCMTAPMVNLVYPKSMYMHTVTESPDDMYDADHKPYTHHADQGDIEKGVSVTTLGETDTGRASHGVLTPGSNAQFARVTRDTMNLMVCLPTMRSVPSLMSMTHMIASSNATITRALTIRSSSHLSPTSSSASSSTRSRRNTKGVRVYAMRFMALRDRMSGILKHADTDTQPDPITNIFRTFGLLNNMRVKTLMSAADHDDVATDVMDAVKQHNVDLVIYPVDMTGSGTSVLTGRGNESCAVAMQLVNNAMCSVAVFGDRGFGVSSISTGAGSVPSSPISPTSPTSTSDEKDIVQASAMTISPLTRGQSTISASSSGSIVGSQLVLLVFTGGPDDREAALLSRWLCSGNGSSLTVLVVPTPYPVAPSDAMLDAAIIQMLSSIPGVTVTHIDPVLPDTQPIGTGILATATHVLDTVITHAQSYGPKDLVIIGKHLYDTPASSQGVLQSPATRSVVTVPDMTTPRTGSVSSAVSNTEHRDLKAWLDGVSVSSFMVVACKQTDVVSGSGLAMVIRKKLSF